LVLIQGSLVLARGLGSTAPFHRALAALPEELLAGSGDRS
jgi:TetR/AcrR family transcriptional regulator, lmrAB and yxaGH operons repressor